MVNCLEISKQHWAIFIREAARIQSFPKKNGFEFPRTIQLIQVSNVVSPILVKGIVQEFKDELRQEE